jgi:hypothetical protein
MTPPTPPASTEEPIAEALEFVETHELEGMAKIIAGLCERLASPPPGGVGEGWRPTHRHVKRGGLYRVLGGAKLQTAEALSDDTYLIIYQDERGLLWARPQPEFSDGRFERLTPDVPAPPLGGGEAKSTPENRSEV